MGFDADADLLRRAGVELSTVDGCCGLAGNFGFERGHFGVSMDCAELSLLPAVRDAAPATAVLANGFSCRTQIEHAGTGRQAVHVAELLAAGLRGEHLADHPERRAAHRPGPPQTARDARDTRDTR